MSLHQGQLVKTKQKTHTQEKQINNKYDPAEKRARRLWLKTKTTNLFP